MSSCLRVLHVVATNDRRGAEAFAVDLETALRDRGLSGSVVALAHSRSSALLAIDVVGDGALRPRTLRELRRRSREVDVVVAHGSRTIPACAVALMASRVPLVVTYIGDPRYWAATTTRRLRLRTALRRAQSVVAVAEGIREGLVQHLSLPEDLVTVIPNGRDRARFERVDSTRRAAAREAFGVPLDASVLLALGALSPEKRLDRTLDAVARLPGTYLLVVGDGPLGPEIESLAAVSSPGRVRLCGPTQDSRAALAAADVLVLTSETEGVPGVLVEAGMSGLPAVTTDVGFTREVVLDGVTGFVVPQDDADALVCALRRALGDRERLGTNAAEFCASRFDMSGVLERWSAVLAHAARRNGKGRPA